MIGREESEALRQEIREDKEQKAKAEVQKEGQEKREVKAKEWTETIEVGYKDGAYITTTDGRFLLRLDAAVEGLFDHQALEARTGQASFRIRRARLDAGGNAFSPWMQVDTQITLEGASVARRDATLALTAWKEVQPTVGQFKVPLDREFLTSGVSLRLIERSMASDEFSFQREVGVQIGGRRAGDRIEYRVGMFNDSGANRVNVNTDFIYVVRLVYSPFGSGPYSQAALTRPTDAQLSLALSAACLPGLQPGERRTLAGRRGDASALPVQGNVVQLTTDLALQYRSFSLEGADHFRSIDPRASTTFGNTDAHGFFVQAGYFLVPKPFEAAARCAFVEPNNPNSVSRNQRQAGR